MQKQKVERILLPNESPLDVLVGWVLKGCSHVVLPHKKVISSFQRHPLLGKIILPKIISLDRPLGYEASCLQGNRPLPFAKGLWWMVDFIRKHEGPSNASMAHLIPLASSLMALWEEVDFYGGDWRQLDTLTCHHLSGSSQKTLTLLRHVGGAWTRLVRDREFCTKSQMHREGLAILASRWAHTPPGHLVALFRSSKLSGVSFLKVVRSLPSCCVLMTKLFHHQLSDDQLSNSRLPDTLLSGAIFSATSKGISTNTPKETVKESTKETLYCTSRLEQARIIGLLVKEGYALGQTPVAILNPSAQLMAYLEEELRPLQDPQQATFQGPLFSTLLSVILEGVIRGWPLRELLCLARHPLVIKTYPIALLMASNAEKLYGHLQPNELNTFGMTGSGVSDGDYPGWVRKALGFIQQATKDLQKATSLSLNLSKWLELHLKVASLFTPESFKNGHGLVDLFKPHILVHSPLLSIQAYALTLKSILSGYPAFTNLSPCFSTTSALLIVSTLEEIDLLHPRRLILVEPLETPSFPWITRGMKEALSIPVKPPIQRPSLPNTSWITVLLATHSNSLSNIQPRVFNEESINKAAHNNQQEGIPRDAKDKVQNSPHHETQLIPSTNLTPPIYRISVSDLQLWKVDPEAFYKRKVLGIHSHHLSIYQLWGIGVHTVLHHFIKRCPPDHPFSRETLLWELTSLAKIMLPPCDFIQSHLIGLLLESIVDTEWKKRQACKYISLTEVGGVLAMTFKEGKVELVARADRIDFLEDGTAHVIDYKTGKLPTFKDLEQHRAVQLPLEGLLVELGQFESPKKVRVTELSWWHLKVGHGCAVKTYPRSIRPLLEDYHKQLPLWLGVFARGTYTEID